MLAEERFERIKNIVDANGSARVQDLIDQIGISESTVRRDLNSMDAAGLITKVHGGAISKNNNVATSDDTVVNRKLLNAEEKRLIGKYAASLIEEDDFVYIDAGTTTEFLIDYITVKNTVFVTNAVSHAKKLADKGLKVFLLGGEFKARTEAIVGEEALSSLNKYNFSKGFWGTNGISPKNGFTTPEVKEAAVKGGSMRNCKDRYVLADPTKFGEVSSITFAEFEKATIITTALKQEAYRKYKNIKEVK